MMPLNTRRSSTRFKPRVSLGNNGSIRAHCSSENLNNSAISSSLGTRTTESMHLRFAYPLKLIKGSWPYSLLTTHHSLLTPFASLQRGQAFRGVEIGEDGGCALLDLGAVVGMAIEERAGAFVAGE